jgi:16S rRNA (guanine527-N7)-methyltransferase
MNISDVLEKWELPDREKKRKLLVSYNALLMIRNQKVNLTGIKNPAESLVKNIFDSLTVYDPAFFPENGKLLDIGTGAGFPGVPLAVIRPDLDVTLMDAIQKKLNFIEDASRELHIENVSVLHMRTEDAGRRKKLRGSFDVVTARAVKSLPVILEWALPFLKKGGVFCAMKGPGVQEELEQSGRILREMNGELVKTNTLRLPSGEERVILYIRLNDWVPKKFPRKVGIAERQPILGK